MADDGSIDFFDWLVQFLIAGLAFATGFAGVAILFTPQDGTPFLERLGLAILLFGACALAVKYFVTRRAEVRAMSQAPRA